MGRFTLFKRQRPATAPVRPPRPVRPELPLHIEQEIDHVRLAVRTPDDDGPRVAVWFDDYMGFIYSDEAAVQHAAKLWPELDTEQATEAARRLRRRVRRHLREWDRFLKGGDQRPQMTRCFGGL